MNIKAASWSGEQQLIECPSIAKQRQRIAVRHILGDDLQPLCRRKYPTPQQIFYDYKRDPDCNSCLMFRDRLSSIDWSKADYEIAAEKGFKNTSR